LHRLITEFVGYLHREEGMSFARADLVKDGLGQYFALRHAGDLDPQPSLLQRALHPQRRLPKPPAPVHALCPERVTLEVHIARLMGTMRMKYYTATALFLAVPAWLRFLERQQLISADMSRKVLTEMRRLHAALLQFWENHVSDPTLFRDAKEWPPAT
jgi:hypothetical protein